MSRIMILCLILLLVPGGLVAKDDSPTEPFAHLQSVQALDQFIESMRILRNTVLEDAANDREASEGMRFVLRTVAMAQDVSGDGYTPAPHFARMDTRRRKIGGDNPDGEYDNVVWDGSVDYKITGNIGSVDHFSFTALSVQPSGQRQQIGYVNERTIGADESGDFTLWLSGEKPSAPGYWIKTGVGNGSILVRQYFGDRATERPASYEIQAVDRERFAPLPPSTDVEVARAIHGARFALNGIGMLHRYVSPGISDPPNIFLRRNSDDFGADISSPDNLYIIGTYSIDPDEALIVEIEPLNVRFWNLAIENPWHESVDYWQRKGSRTHDDITTDSDGIVRFVIAHAPTEHPNYLETAGHSRGFMTFRWVGERDTRPPLPKVTKVALTDAMTKARALADVDPSD